MKRNEKQHKTDKNLAIRLLKFDAKISGFQKKEKYFLVFNNF